MRRMLFLLFAALAITPFLLFVHISYSHACAQRGDTMSAVLYNCGEPTWVDRRQEWRWQTVPAGTIVDGWYVGRQPRTMKILLEIEQWTYDLGRNKFIRIFTFENGILTSIETGGYGRH